MERVDAEDECRDDCHPAAAGNQEDKSEDQERIEQVEQQIEDMVHQRIGAADCIVDIQGQEGEGVVVPLVKR